MEQRKELLPDRHDLPSRYWEPQPDEEDLERMERENERGWMIRRPQPIRKEPTGTC